MYIRKESKTLLARLAEKPRALIVVCGPRQCGKTTLIQQVLQRISIPHTYLSADHARTSSLGSLTLLNSLAGTTTSTFAPVKATDEWLIRVWQEARAKTTKSNGHILVIDEIQKIANWSEIVKGLWDNDRLESRNLHVVLLGSAPLTMQEGLSESLLGRYETIDLTHWLFTEMQQAFGFTLDEFIYFGGYPGSADLISDEIRWRNFIRNAVIEPNVERDILAMQRIDKPALLKRLFELACLYATQTVSYNKMLGQLRDAGNTTTLARYLDLLAKASLVSGLSNYRASHVRVRSSSPKLLSLNPGLISALSNYPFDAAVTDRTHWGRLVENAVGAHIKNTMSSFTQLYYWRDGSNEVDFVLETANNLLGLEVKSGRHRATTRGLSAFKETFPDAKAAIVGSDQIPLHEFFELSADQLLTEL